MSLFKVKDWWSNSTIHEPVPPDSGLVIPGSLKVDKFAVHSDSDCFIYGQDKYLRVYKPNDTKDTSQLLLECELENVIVSLETGKFTSDVPDRQILVLHPQRYAIYKLEKREGHTDAGEQNILKLLIKHTFTRKAYSVICGPFGKIKSRDLFCIQGMDGSLSFFDQDIFIFLCLFEDILIPSPVAYISNCDSFVVCKSTWIMEIYGYEQLREISELNQKQNKKVVPQWIYNGGEEISAVQVIQTSSNFSSILALGERYMYCFQDNGLMKYMKRIDFVPVTFYAYLIGWYYEPGARLLVMVASDDAKLYVYEGATLLWSCDLLVTPITICRCFVKSLPGGIVTLSPQGILNIQYLGTEPDLSPSGAAVINEVTNPDEVEEELVATEKVLDKILNDNKDSEGEQIIDNIIKIKLEAGIPVVRPKQNIDYQKLDTSPTALMCPIVAIIYCDDPESIQAVQITYICQRPLVCNDSTICLNSVNGTEIIETQVFIEGDEDVPNGCVKLMFTITNSYGQIYILDRIMMLPPSLYCVPKEIITDGESIVKILTNKPAVEFSDLFADIPKAILHKYDSNKNIVTFEHLKNKKFITLKIVNGQYTLQSIDFAEIIPILEYVTLKLIEHFKNIKDGDFKIRLEIKNEVKNQLIYRFLKSVEAHAKERIKVKKYENDLKILQKQFTLIQKKLLVQYGSSPPGDCDQLEYLMKDTHQRLINVAHEIITATASLNSAGCTVAAIGRLIVFYLKINLEDDFKTRLIDDMLSIESLYDRHQDWEETVTQSLSYVLNKVFQKSEKDKEKLAPVTEQGVLSHINLKRFIRQLKIILEKIFSEIPDADTDNILEESAKTNQITRIEELVEVL